MYQVLYRKYRPKTFEDVCGQTVIVKLLKNSINRNKVSHAYLFAGPRGTGKTSMAKIFARVINCDNPNDLVPCGECVNCTQNTNDVIEIDAASNNGVDEIRELRNKVNLVPTSGKYKIYIIDEVHMLTTGAFNALLKTLEEPPSHVIFILATTDPHKIPETILSRCQRLDFKKISVDEIVGKLSEIAKKENIEVDEESLREIAILSDGGLRDSISLLDEAGIFSDGKITKENIHEINGTLSQEEIIDFIKALKTSDCNTVFNKVDEYNCSGKNFVKLTEEIISCLKDILLYMVAPNYFQEINKPVENFKNISQEISKQQIIDYIYEFNRSFNEMSKTNNNKLVFELAIIKLININDSSNGEEVVTKVKTASSETEVVDYSVKEKEQTEISNIAASEKINPIEETVQKDENVDVKVVEYDEETNDVDEELLTHLRNIRISNTLSKFNKKLLLELKNDLANITGFLLDPNYSNYVSIIMDGALKAASDTNIVFVFNKKVISDDFNMNLLIVEEMLERLFGKHYDVISTWNDEWEIIKSDFNGKKKEYIYQKEDFNLNDVLSTKGNNELNDLFGDIIEYN